MIPEFPNFTPTKVSLKSEFEKHTIRFDPYSEFTFPCLFSWDTENSSELSLLNNNLVIKMPDYISRIPFYSLIGDNSIDNSIELLLSEVDQLRLVPEIVVSKIGRQDAYSIQEDRNQFDYVYSTDDQVTLMGGHFKNRRKKNGLFLRSNWDNLIIKKLDLNKNQDAETVLKVFDKWVKFKGDDNTEVNHEKEALNKLLKHSKYFNFIVLGIFIENTPVGFSINEIVQNGFAMCRFQKTTEIAHLDVFLSNLVAKEIKHYGSKYISWEQDLGIPGLRNFKESYRPVKFLKKYTVTRL